MARHIADHNRPSRGGRVRNYLRLGRSRPETWHRSHAAPGSTRLVQFLRIARGRLT
jgi:hypothetical protein